MATPCKNGVEFDSDGRVTAYHVYEYVLGHTLFQPLPVRIPAFTGFGRRNVVHLFQVRDGGQVRGYPPTAPSLTPAQLQHRLAGSDEALSQHLRGRSSLPLSEPEDKEPIERGRVYLAPADYHLLVEEGRFALSTEARVGHARPSIDVFFESAAQAYRERLVGVILTGASKDGAQGLWEIKERGGKVVVQDPVTAEVATMPAAALDAVAPDRVLPIGEIAAYLVSLVLGG